MTYARDVTAQLIDTDGITVISGVLDDAFGIVFMKELNGFGTGTCSLALSDSDADDLTRGRFVQILVAGTARFTFKIEGSPQYHQIDIGEESTQILTVSGRGWGCIWEEFVVYPDGGLDVSHVLDYSYRLFSFASMTFPNISGWGPAQEMYEYFDGISYGARVDSLIDPGADPDDPADDVVKLYPAPIGFPWPNDPKNGNGFAPTPTYEPTFWVCADGAPDEQSIGFHFFRGSFTLAGEQDTKFMITGDNLFTLFLNGIPILGEADDTLVWKGWKEVTLTLPAGEYVVGAVVENIDADVTYNPGGLLLAIVAVAIYPGDIETTDTLALLTSSAADLVGSFFAADEWPGYSPSQIIDVVGDEAQSRGAIPAYVGSTVAEFTDSNGNDWDSLDPDTTLEFVPTFSVRLGSTGGDVLRQLHDEGWIDWMFQGDSLTLDAFTPLSLGGASAATFTAGTNITGLERGESKPYANVLLVQYANGFTESEDLAEVIAAGGRIEDVYSTDAATVDEAQRLGRVELVRRAVDANPAVLISIEPSSAADCPFEAFDVGDNVTIPGAFAGTQVVQVLSISCEQDDEGHATWRMELNARWRSPEAEAIDLLRTIGGKTLGSAANHGVAKD